MGLIDDLGDGPVGLDTVVFIYFMEEHPDYVPLVDPMFLALDRGLRMGVTSGVTLLECLVVPYRSGDVDLAARYEVQLTRSRGLRLVDIDRPLLRAAAQLRATLGIRTPDALQVAAALRERATAFVTNDRKLPSVPGLRILQLRDYLPARQ